MACAGTIERREACVCDVTIFPLVKIEFVFPMDQMWAH